MEESKKEVVRPTLMKAFVVGISDYSNIAGTDYPDLPKSKNDAEAVAKLFKEKLYF